MIRNLMNQIFFLITLIEIIVKDFHDFHVDFLEDSLKKNSW